MKHELLIRWLFYFAGLFILAFGVSLTIEGKALGISPWDSFHYGLFAHFGLTIGQWSIIAGAFIIFGTCLFTKSLPKLGALINMLLIGLLIDFFTMIIPEPHSLIVSTITFITGVLIIGYGIGIYVSAGLGAGPRDTLTMLISEKTGMNVKKVRNMIEISVLAIGWLLGGPIGIGTIIIALFTGTILSYSLPQSKHLLRLIIIKFAEKASHPAH
ncbi:YitT family protein [Bacillus gobiensis]|uniref:YczE/YyaS/YitT family protein n=1 Tax=Bacillus gobiensis TaxID=1441095 RepID=UPI003D20BF72